MREVNENVQLVPPHIHRRNSAERVIQTLKEHFIAGLSRTLKDFPLHLWCRILPHASITLKLLRKSRMNSKLSGYAQLNRELNYDTPPLAPPGTHVIIYENPTVIGTWESHGVKGWYLGPSMSHYRCHHVYVTKERGEQDSDWVEFSPHNTPLHYNSSSENVIIAARELAYDLNNLAPQAPFSNIGDSQIFTIDQLPRYFKWQQIMREKQQILHKSKQWKNPPLYLRKCIKIGPNLFPQYIPMSLKMMRGRNLQIFSTKSTCTHQVQALFLLKYL